MKRFLLPKKTLIIANGEKPDLALLKIYREQAQTIIALDGAADWLYQHGIRPDVIIGDMDSISPVYRHDDNVIMIAEQDSNDLEKALNYCKAQGFLEITILGAYGLRLDHVLTNLFVLKKFSSTLIMTLVDAKQAAFICPKNQELVFDNASGWFISLYPLNEQVGPIWTHGVQYPLANAMLSLTSSISTLNRIIADKATVFCKKGDLLVLTPSIYGHDR